MESEIRQVPWGHVRKPRDSGNGSVDHQVMELDQDAAYRAFCMKDARFDGRIFGAVRTTGIYCRPVCPARTPKVENICFYPSAAAAQEAGFRPCLRCRPETSPDLGSWNGTSNTVSRALALIEQGVGDVGEVVGRIGDEPEERAAPQRTATTTKYTHATFLQHALDAGHVGFISYLDDHHPSRMLRPETTAPA